ncbi:MAG: hypothetical protein H7099_11160 [Gemmatimonadaceae bacterium]|nr:hypothetical protein [Gemmatimonadaceae bacterium]
MLSRRSFLSVAGLAGASLVIDRRPLQIRHVSWSAMTMCGTAHAHAGGATTHPAPRAGVTAARVLTGAKLAKWPDLVQLFDGIRAIPAIADGIRCSCGCAEIPGYYSLLSCYEGDAMATICPICQGTGRLAVRLHAEGQTLAQIRVAVDAQFG